MLPGLAAVWAPTGNVTSAQCQGPSGPHQVACRVAPSAQRGRGSLHNGTLAVALPKDALA